MRFKTYSEAAKVLLNCNYYNSKVKEKLLRYCKDNCIILDIGAEKNYCLQCGKEIKKGKKFCDSSCAAKYNNKRRKVSKVQKQKVSQTLKQKYLNAHNGEPFTRKVYKKICPVCEREFIGKKNQIYCSHKCANNSIIVKEKISKKAKERINNGTFKGWNTRNIKSYAEFFWEKVLNENGIDFVRESFETKKYFLDFFLKKNDRKIDLEIDGKQHKNRKQHDIERDIFLKNLGYEVYRIPWNEIRTERGKKEMKKKIEDFLLFYNKN